MGGWEACGKDLCGFRFGWFDKGTRADIIALDADPRDDPKALRKVSFVMKDGQVWCVRHYPLAASPKPCPANGYGIIGSTKVNRLG